MINHWSYLDFPPKIARYFTKLWPKIEKLIAIQHLLKNKNKSAKLCNGWTLAPLFQVNLFFSWVSIASYHFTRSLFWLLGIAPNGSILKGVGQPLFPECWPLINHVTPVECGPNHTAHLNRNIPFTPHAARSL